MSNVWCINDVAEIFVCVDYISFLGFTFTFLRDFNCLDVVEDVSRSYDYCIMV